MNLKKIIELILTFVTSLFQCLQIKKPQHHFLSYKNDGFYLDGIKIIDQKAVSQKLVFKVLFLQHARDISEASSNYVSIKQINTFLRQNGMDSDDYEARIRKIINRIRTSVWNKTQFQIIDSESWKGYKINPTTFIGKL